MTIQEPERFAYDLFHYIWSQMKVIPGLEMLKEMYPTADSNKFELPEKLGKAVVCMQLCYRSALQKVFECEKPSLSIDDERFLGFVDNYLASKISGDVFDQMTVSCLIYAEFTLFKYAKCNENCFRSAPKCWSKYFCNRLSQTFDLQGGCKELDARLSNLQTCPLTEYFLCKLKNPYDTIDSIEYFNVFRSMLKEKTEDQDSWNCSSWKGKEIDDLPELLEGIEIEYPRDMDVLGSEEDASMEHCVQ